MNPLPNQGGTYIRDPLTGALIRQGGVTAPTTVTPPPSADPEPAAKAAQIPPKGGK